MSKSLEWSRSGISMRGYLALIVISILAPALLFAGILFSRYYAKELDSIEEQLRNNARELALGIDRELQGQLYALYALSVAQTIRDHDFEAFYQQAARVRDLTGFDILMRDRSGQQLLNTRVPWGTPLPVEAVPGDAEVIATKKPFISGVFIGAVARRPIYTITVPVIEQDQVAYFLQLSLELQRLADVLNANIRPDRTAAIVDRNSMFMARTRQFDRFVGQRAGTIHRAPR
jgi:two-component system, sensor histidine kinase